MKKMARLKTDLELDILVYESYKSCLNIVIKLSHLQGKTQMM